MLTMQAATAALVFCAGLSVLTLVCVGTLLYVRARPVSSFEARLNALELDQEGLKSQHKRLLNSRAGREHAKAAAREEAEEEVPVDAEGNGQDEAALSRAIRARFGR